MGKKTRIGRHRIHFNWEWGRYVFVPQRRYVGGWVALCPPLLTYFKEKVLCRVPLMSSEDKQNLCLYCVTTGLTEVVCYCIHRPHWSAFMGFPTTNMYVLEYFFVCVWRTRRFQRTISPCAVTYSMLWRVVPPHHLRVDDYKLIGNNKQIALGVEENAECFRNT